MILGRQIVLKFKGRRKVYFAQLDMGTGMESLNLVVAGGDRESEEFGQEIARAAAMARLKVFGPNHVTTVGAPITGVSSFAYQKMRYIRRFSSFEFRMVEIPSA